MELAVDHRTPSLSAPPSRATGSGNAVSRPEALRDVLAELGERVKPITLARERTLPVAAPFDRLLPDEGLVRGRVVSCRGAADTSLAFGLIADALAKGAWAAVVDVATFGADAASEFGVPLERIVRVDSGVAQTQRAAGVGAVMSWIDVMGAAIDGFDVVVTTVPAELRQSGSPNARPQHGRHSAAIRKLVTRIQQKGAVVVVLGEPAALGCDLVLSTERTEWRGVTSGAGHLRSRRVSVAAGGRRLPQDKRVSLVVDASSGGVACSLAVADDDSLVTDLAESGDERDPQAELLAEMADNLDSSQTDHGGDHRLVG